MNAGLFLHALSVEARKEMSYRVDFWLNLVLGFLAELGVYIFLAWALFAESGVEQIRGYTRQGMVVYFIAAVLIGKIVRGNEMGQTVSEDIYDGGLTRYLLFPRSYVLLKYAQHLGRLLPFALQGLLFGGVALLVLDSVGGVHVTPLGAMGSAVSILVAGLLYFLIGLPLHMVAFWQDNVWSLSVMLRFLSRLLGGAMLPLALFPEWSRQLLWWLPFRHFFDVPVRTLLGQVGFLEWFSSLGLALAWCAAFALLGGAVWRRGNLQYTGVGI